MHSINRQGTNRPRMFSRTRAGQQRAPAVLDTFLRTSPRISGSSKATTVSSSNGFTLIELLVTVAVAAIVLVVAVPSFADLIKNNRLTAATNDLIASLSLARSEAVKRELRVTVCKSADGASCVTTGEWEQGWIVFTDDKANVGVVDGGEVLLRVHEAIPGAVTMSGNNNVVNYISYVASGWGQGAGGAIPNGTINVCGESTGNVANVGKEILLSNTGRARVDVEVVCP